MDSRSGTDSAGIWSARCLDLAVDITISSPRSIGIILECFSGVRRMKNQHVVVNLHIDRPLVVHVESERRPLAGNMNILLRYGNTEFGCFSKDIHSNGVNCLPRSAGIFHLLANVIVEFE